MSDVLGVRFREVGKICYYPCEKGNNIKTGDYVIVFTKRGLEYGTVMLKKDISDKIPEFNFGEERVIRKALAKDMENIQKNKQCEKRFFAICKEKILEYGLKMKLIGVDYIFDRSRLIFYFVADGRVDFRNLVRELAYIFKTRIELRQIGVRDEAKMVGGLGICGKPLCCATFLNDFQSVSVKMAKDQGLSLNPTKISGVCGRLMCCLKFEEDAYLDILYDMPPQRSVVKTPNGVGRVVSQNPINKTVKVCIEGTQGGVPETFGINDIEVIDCSQEKHNV